MYELLEDEAILINGGDTHFYFASEGHKRLVIIVDVDIIEGTDKCKVILQSYGKQLIGRDREVWSLRCLLIMVFDCGLRLIWIALVCLVFPSMHNRLLSCVSLYLAILQGRAANHGIVLLSWQACI